LQLCNLVIVNLKVHCNSNYSNTQLLKSPILSMSFRSQTRRARQNGEQGYALITLLLIFAIMGIMAATLVTSIKFDIQRDREEEMIHRGVQYSRAVRAYYRKFGRYPATIENLENTNQMRFLRKRYKDPITGKDFKLLHFGEVKMGIYGMAGGGGVIPGASSVGPNGTLTTQGGLSNSSFGNNTSGNSSSFGQAQKTGTDSSQQTDSGTDANGSQTNSSGGASDQGSGDQPVRTFGGMPIVGVASTSKRATIREFENKKKYNEWLFVYDPGVDRGFLITTPYQPQQQMFGVAQQNLNPPQNPTPGLGTSAPGSGGTAPVPPPNNNTPGNPNQPTDTPNQQ
jgi:type II secretory pathway pseudopilin PulG